MILFGALLFGIGLGSTPTDTAMVIVGAVLMFIGNKD